MTEQKQETVKLNKNHGGKEFNNYFRFIGKVRKVQKKEDETWIDKPYFENTTTQTNKPRRVVQFNLETSKENLLKVEQNGMEKEFAYAYSSSDRKSFRVNWADRFDKSKFPNDSYHLMLPEWDMCEVLGAKLEDDIWVEVKGKYEFSTFDAGQGEMKLVKRMVTSIKPIENGQEVKIGQAKVNYITDFDAPDFVEVNSFTMQVGILSTYQEEDSKDTKVNGVYLTYGKEKSTPQEVELIVPYKEPEAGKISLADGFAKLNRLDFIQVQGVDNNRAEYTYIEVEEDNSDFNPFADVSEEDKKKQMKRVTSGTKKGLEVTAVVNNTYIKEMLTEEEVSNEVVIDISDDDLPF